MYSAQHVHPALQQRRSATPPTASKCVCFLVALISPACLPVYLPASLSACLSVSLSRHTQQLTLMLSCSHCSHARRSSIARAHVLRLDTGSQHQNIPPRRWPLTKRIPRRPTPPTTRLSVFGWLQRASRRERRCGVFTRVRWVVYVGREALLSHSPVGPYSHNDTAHATLLTDPLTTTAVAK